MKTSTAFLIVILVLSLIAGVFAYETDQPAVTENRQNEIIILQQEKIDELKSEIAGLKAGRNVQAASFSKENRESGFAGLPSILLILSCSVSGALGFALIKSRKKPDPCRCAVRREQMRKKALLAAAE